MTLKEAIRLLQMDVNDPGSVDIMDLNQAEELLIEAGKRIQEQRYYFWAYREQLLPGETLE